MSPRDAHSFLPPFWVFRPWWPSDTLQNNVNSWKQTDSKKKERKKKTRLSNYLDFLSKWTDRLIKDTLGPANTLVQIG